MSPNPTASPERTAQDHDRDENILIEFIRSLFGDADKAQHFNENPAGCLADADLSHVTPQQVHDAVEVVVQSIPAPTPTVSTPTAPTPGGGGGGGGGGGHWEPPACPPDSSAASIIQQITNNYYQQIIHTEIYGDNNTVVQAIGDGAVAAGGDINAPVATTGGVAGADNKVGNEDKTETTNVDASRTGDNSGNTTITDIEDNSKNDSHNELNIGAGEGGRGGDGGPGGPGTAPPAPVAAPVAPAPAPVQAAAFHPVPIGVDAVPLLTPTQSSPAPAEPVVQAFEPVPATLLASETSSTEPVQQVNHTAPENDSELVQGIPATSGPFRDAPVEENRLGNNEIGQAAVDHPDAGHSQGDQLPGDDSAGDQLPGDQSGADQLGGEQSPIEHLAAPGDIGMETLPVDDGAYSQVYDQPVDAAPVSYVPEITPVADTAPAATELDHHLVGGP